MAPVSKSFLVAVVLASFCSIERTAASARLSKRESLVPPPLVYPFGGTIKLLVGCAIPIAMPGRIMSFGQNVQFQYALPQNASFFSDYFKPKGLRKRRSADIVNERSLLYQFIVDEIERHGGLGKDCMKRTMCESAETPLKDDGLVGEILHVLLTPDYGDSQDVDEDYRQAAEVGRRGEDCTKAYPSCPKGFGILDHITQLFD